MRVLLTTHQFFPEFAAGTEVLVRSVARDLRARGHEVRVFTGYPSTTNLADADRLDEYDVEGIHVYRFHHAYQPMGGQTSNIALGFDNHLAASFFAQALQRFKPDVVHFFHLNRLGTGLIDQTVAAKVPAFLTPTDFWLVCPTAKLVLPDGSPCAGPTPLAGNCIKHFAQAAQAVQRSHVAKALVRAVPVNIVEGWIRLSLAGRTPAYPHRDEVHALQARLGVNVRRLNTVHKIMAPTRYMADVLKRFGVEPHRIVESSYGIDALPTLPPHAPYQAGMLLRIAYIGTLAEYKGCHVLLDAFKTLSPGSSELRIYGRESDFPAYSAQLRKSAQGMAGVRFCGVFDNADIGNVLSEADVLVVPSLWLENTPLVVYSAQAARCVVVGSNFAGIAASVADGVNGLLFEPGNAQALAAALVRLQTKPGLLDALRNQCAPPKTTVTYVDELLNLWEPS